MLALEFHLEAEAEMRDAADYYEERAPGLGSDFLDDIERGSRYQSRSGEPESARQIGKCGSLITSREEA